MMLFSPEMLALLWPAMGVVVLMQYIAVCTEWGCTMNRLRIIATTPLWPLFLIEMLREFCDSMTGGRYVLWALGSIVAFVYVGAVVILTYHPAV